MAFEDYSYLPNKVAQLEPKHDWRRAMDKLTVTNKQVEEISDSQPLWCDSIFHQKAHVWVAPPNGGKTTIATSAAAQLAKDGYEVLYFNLDAGSSDLKHYQALAEGSGYRLIAPLEAGTSEADCIDIIAHMLEDDDLSDCVVFLDTLKKFTDVIQKQRSKKFYAQIRGLTVRGCTVVALAHTNKHPDSDGKLVYEGTGDLKADFDIMMMLYPSKTDTELVVSTEFEKERAPVKPQTFSIDQSRNVKVSGEYTNTRELEHARRQEALDTDVIDFIKHLISSKPMNQSAVITACKEAGMGNRKPMMRVLRAYKNKHWTVERGFQNNEWRYISTYHSP
jgi:hypothetical protein